MKINDMRERKRKMEKIEEMKSCTQDELKELLIEIGYIDKIEKGKIKCLYCGNTITLNNIFSIFKKNKQIVFVCKSLECIRQFGNEV